MSFSSRNGISDTSRSRNRNLVKDFFSCQHLLSNEEILEFLSGNEQESNCAKGFIAAQKRLYENPCDEHIVLRHAFYRRKADIRQLTAKLRDGHGGARIDEDGRLIPAMEPPQPPRANLPPVGDNDGDNANIGDNPNANANDNPQFFPGNNILDDQQQEELFLEQQRRETQFTITHGVGELRSTNQGHVPVPEEDFEVILLDLRGRPLRAEVPRHLAGSFFSEGQNNNNNNNNINDDEEESILTNLTLRRIAIACFILVAVSLGILLQVLPIISMKTVEESINPVFDSLLNEVLVVRGWRDHVQECSAGLANRSANRHHRNWKWLRRIKQAISYGTVTPDCSEGVLHIPSMRVLQSEYASSSIELKHDLRNYIHGVNVSWFIPCSGHGRESVQQQCLLQEKDGADHQDSEQLATCPGERTFDQCFRGIHDHFIDEDEIYAAITMADKLIHNGGDHFDVHYDISILNRRVPSIVKKVKNLLDQTYLNQRQQTKSTRKTNGSKSNDGRKGLKDNSRSKNRVLEPVAFRVLTTGPMDGHDVMLKQEGDAMSMYLENSSALNETNYLNWVLQSRRHNDQARYQSYYRPWPYRLSPKRETCDLKFDLEADSRFCIQSSIFLTSGSGEDYWGGTNLFVDDHPENFANPSHRIARGVSIDGSKGRIVVSTGGFENLRCRFPTRAGFRTVFQIWWDC